MAFFVEFSAERLLEDDSFFGEEFLGVTEFGLLFLEEFFLLGELSGAEIEVSGEFALFGACASDVGGEQVGAGFEGGAFSIELFLVGGEVSAALVEFSEPLLQGLGGGRGLQQDAEGISIGGIGRMAVEENGDVGGSEVRGVGCSRNLIRRQIDACIF